MIQLDNDFFNNKPWGRQGDTVKLFLFLLSRADDTGTISIKEIGKGAGICCMNKIKFSLRQLEYSGNLEIIKVDGKRTYKINTNEKNDKEPNAGNVEGNTAAGTETKGRLPHIFAKW